jgi:hypothetical protein
MGCCEQVLELLTADAVTADEHERLAEHLCDCPSCRRLAEALSPAVELFRDVLREDATEDSAERLEASLSAMPWDRAPAPPRAWTGHSWLGGMGLAAAVMAGVMLGAIVQSSSTRLASTGPSRFEGADLAVRRVSIESLGLADSCWTQPPVEASVPTPTAAAVHPPRKPALADLSCCTFCHAAGKPLAGQADGPNHHKRNVSARLQTSCQLCHASAQVSAPLSTTRVQ